MSSCTVSVVMPAFDCSGYIGDSLRLLCAQSLGDLEILVIDDASTDGTPALASEIGDRRIKVLVNQENRGPSYSRNRGLSEAGGEWIAFVDADDWCVQSRLERLVDLAELYGADAVADDEMMVEEGVGPTSDTLLGRKRLRVSEGQRAEAEFFTRHDLGVLKPLIRRAFIEEHGIRFDETLRYGEDFDFQLRAILAGAKYCLTPAALYCRRIRPGSLSTEVRSLIADVKRGTAALLADIEGEKYGKADKAELRQLLRQRYRHARLWQVSWSLTHPFCSRRGWSR